jgi:ABC-type branched-subunit amino acid transport system ATPase component
MTAPILVTSALSGGYAKLPVFRDIRISLHKGETIGVCGPNGAGKTTLLKTIAGLLPAFGGRVEFNGRSFHTTKAYERTHAGLVLVPEGRQIFSSLTVRQNLELARAAGRVSSASYPERLQDVLSLFPRLQERLDQSGGALSGGEQQMLAIARALLLDPLVLMLDEPTQGLAPVMIRQVLTTLQALRGKLSIIVVEQNRAFLHELADTIYDMRGGILSADFGGSRTVQHEG